MSVEDYAVMFHGSLFIFLVFLRAELTNFTYNRQLALRKNKYAHGTVVRYVWTKEVGQHGRSHYR